MWVVGRLSSILAVLLCLGACAVPVRQAQASGAPMLFECPGCSSSEIESLLSMLGDGDRYLIDLQGRSMRKFVVAGTPLVPFGNQDDSRSAEELEAETRARLLLISVTETPVDGWAQELYQDLQELYDIDPAYFQNSGATVSMGNYDLGVNPHTGNSFSPFDIWFYGPSNQEWVGFSNRLDQILTSESWSRQVLGDVIATAMFAIFQRFNQVGLQLGPVGGSLGWTQSGPWTINFCYSGYCLKVRIKADRTFEFLEATDEAGNLVPQLFGNGGWGGVMHCRPATRLFKGSLTTLIGAVSPYRVTPVRDG